MVIDIAPERAEEVLGAYAVYAGTPDSPRSECVWSYADLAPRVGQDFVAGPAGTLKVQLGVVTIVQCDPTRPRRVADRIGLSLGLRLWALSRQAALDLGRALSRRGRPGAGTQLGLSLINQAASLDQTDLAQ